MGMFALIGILIAGGAAMLPLMSVSEDEPANDVDSDPSVEDTELENPQVDLVSEISNDKVPGPDEVGSQNSDDTSKDHRVVLNTLDDAEWSSETGIVLSVAEFQDMRDVSTQPVIVRNGVEEEAIDARNTSLGLIYLGEGDALTGSDVADEQFDFVAIAQGGAHIQGGASDEVLIANGNSNVVDGGGGDDLIISDEGASTLSGGEGNDKIIGNGEKLLAPTGGSTAEHLLNDSPDYIDGGGGDDYIVASNGDTVFGGAGADEIVLIGGNATIEDFTPGDDILNVVLVNGAINVDPGTHETYNLDDRIGLVRDGDELTIEVDGNHLLSIKCDETTTVGYSNGGDPSNPAYLTPEGQPGQRPDILLYVEHQYTS